MKLQKLETYLLLLLGVLRRLLGQRLKTEEWMVSGGGRESVSQHVGLEHYGPYVDSEAQMAFHLRTDSKS